MSKNIIKPEYQKFQKELDGKKIELFHLKNENNTEVFLTNYGVRIVSIIFHDKENNPVDINLGHLSIDDYLEPKPNWYGCTIGRVCNRISNAEFTLNGRQYKLKPNIPINLLHGGENSFQVQVFDARKIGDNSVEMKYRSPDGEEGFPGNVDVRIVYTLSSDDALEILYEAETDQDTLFNITNHTFFNLNGEGNGDILSHEVTIFSDRYLPIREGTIPTGVLESVENTPLDFRKPKTVGRDIDSNHPQLIFGSGFDHTYVLKEKFDSEMKYAARAVGDVTGIVLDTYTDQPGIHFYSGNFMDGTKILKTGDLDNRRDALCFETQHFPDAPHNDNFPSIVLKPGEKFTSKTIYKLSLI